MRGDRATGVPKNNKVSSMHMWLITKTDERLEIDNISNPDILLRMKLEDLFLNDIDMAIKLMDCLLVNAPNEELKSNAIKSLSKFMGEVLL